jgi:hypothetical protein
MRKWLGWIVPGVILLVMALSIAYTREILLAFDRLGAAILGADSTHTISASCGSDDTPAAMRYTLCWWVCPALDLIDPEHCARAASGEGGSNI